MGKTKRDIGAAAEAAFHKRYAAIWGEERWHKSLYPALEQPTRYCALVNRYAQTSTFYDTVADRVKSDDLKLLVFPESSLSDSQDACEILCYARQEHEADNGKLPMLLQPFPEPVLVNAAGTYQRLLTHWNLDAASALTAQLLAVKPGDRVLDLCAAPGGKSIALAQCLWPELHANEQGATLTEVDASSGCLRSNEDGVSRYTRLEENLMSYLPFSLNSSGRVSATNIDATKPLAARQLLIDTQAYDKVLVDAPCSSERHIIHAQQAAKAGGRIAPEIANWRPSASKRLAQTQLDLLVTGLKAARTGGIVMYATCAIETVENDGVIDKLLAWCEKEIKEGAKWSVKAGLNGGEGDQQLEHDLAQD